jgi:hypothetical protein|tara:strand:- start:1266 stop:2096 length:831 start_codon:yes stop_codon:yes gene_type:complete
MKIRHNKKRNTAFVYEALIREGTSAILQKDQSRCNRVVAVIKKHFKDGTILKKDLECYKSLYENQNLTELDSARIIKEAKAQKRLIDPSGLFVAQTELIHDINKEVKPSLFNNYVPNYKSLANIYQMFSDSTNPRDAVLLENLVIGNMASPPEQKQENNVDRLVVDTFVNKFNKKYKEELFEEQKALLNLYIQSFVDNSVEFKSFLNEEITRLKRELKEAKLGEHISSDEEMTEKANDILLKLESLKKTEINDDILLTVLKVQSLIRETNSDGDSN